MWIMCVEPQLLSHSPPKPEANERVGFVPTAEPGLCVAGELDLSPSHGWLGYRRGWTSHGTAPKPLWMPQRPA